MPFQYTFRSDDIPTWDVDTRDLLENRDRELELYSTTIDDSFLNLNASNLTSGTVPSARMTGAYTGITDVGTLGSLTVTGDLTVDTNTLRVDSANNRVGINVTTPTSNLDIVGNQVIRAASGQDGIQLAGRAGGTGSATVKLIPTTLTANRTLTLPNVDGTAICTGNLSSITAVGTLSSGSIPATLLTGTTLPATIVTSSLTSVGTLTGLTTSGQVTISRGALGTTAGDQIVFLDPNGTTSNGDKLDTRLIRNSNGSDWTTAVWRMGRLVDATRMGFIQFGDGAGGQDVRLGVGTTTYGTVNTSGLYVTGEIYATSNIRISTSGANFVAQSPSTGAGFAAQWVSAFGLYILFRNTSTRNDKENIQPLNGIVTANMIDDIEISLWNRKGATGFPEIGPMAEDMDDISPFLSIKGMDCDENGNIVATAPGGINQNSWLSLLTLGMQDIRKRVEQLENP